jgi:hypothetical protein
MPLTNGCRLFDGVFDFDAETVDAPAQRGLS